MHGALTPDSVMVNSAGRVKLTDFGLARTLKPLDNFRAQVAAGTMAALAPEMMEDPESADARADLYSVGVILFELLTGRTPADSFERPSVAAPGVPPAVDPVVELCLKPSPDDCYPTRRRSRTRCRRRWRPISRGRTRRRRPRLRCRRAPRRKRARRSSRCRW